MNPASRRPRLNPPAPLKRSSAFGPLVARTHFLTADRSLGSGEPGRRGRRRACPRWCATAVRLPATVLLTTRYRYQPSKTLVRNYQSCPAEPRSTASFVAICGFCTRRRGDFRQVTSGWPCDDDQFLRQVIRTAPSPDWALMAIRARIPAYPRVYRRISAGMTPGPPNITVRFLPANPRFEELDRADHEPRSHPGGRRFESA